MGSIKKENQLFDPLEMLKTMTSSRMDVSKMALEMASDCRSVIKYCEMKMILKWRVAPDISTL